MRRPITDQDPGDEQTRLFAPASLEPKTCSCGTTKKNLCRWAANRHFDGINNPQPRTCLLRYDPKEGVIPF